MQFVLFSKHWKDLDVAGMIEKCRYIEADGFDFAVRRGFIINPDNVRTALPEAANEIRKAGLHIPIITLDGDFTDPDAPVAEQTAAAMQEAGIPLAKLGYWTWKAGETPYWQTVDKIRRGLEGFEKLGRKYGVTFCYHTHSGYFGLNAAAMMHLLQGRDPKYIGAYLDTGHLYYCGEPFPMAVDMVGEYLSFASFKETFFKRANPETEELPNWKRAIVPAGHGVVNWPDVFRSLRGAGYDGACSCHCEFSADSPQQFTELQKREVAFLREQYAAVNR